MNKTDAVNKFIVFMIADYFLALPISAVVKVVNYPNTTTQSLKAAGLVQIGKHTLKVLDLHQKLATYAPQLLINNPFLIIIQVFQGELCAIPVTEPPNLVEIPKDSIQALPNFEGQDGLLDIVSHVAVLSEAETFTIFIIDINLVLNATFKSIAPRLISMEQ